MHRLKIFRLLRLWFSRPVSAVAQDVGPDRSISLGGHHSDPRQSEVHDADRGAIH